MNICYFTDKHSILIRLDFCYREKVGIFLPDFISLGISKILVEKLNKVGVSEPTPIQKRAIPFLMEGKDVIAQAQTGTGKTFAFILPILEKLDPDASHVQALIVTPTRELALQITAEFEKLTADLKDVDVLAVYGGQDVDKQLRKLKRNVQVVVGTPGRLSGSYSKRDGSIIRAIFPSP